MPIILFRKETYSGIPFLRTSKGNGNWFEKSGSSRIGGKMTVFDWGGETTFGSMYREVRRIEGSRNRDSTVESVLFFKFDLRILCPQAIRSRRKKTCSKKINFCGTETFPFVYSQIVKFLTCFFFFLLLSALFNHPTKQSSPSAFLYLA